MHTLTVLFPVLIGNKSFSCFALSLLFQVNKNLSSCSPSSLLSSTCLYSFLFFSIFFLANICFINYLLSTHYVLKTVLGYKDSRLCKTQSLSLRSLPPIKGERSNQIIILKEDMYTLEVCLMYTDEKWMSVDVRVIRCEEGGGRQRYA